MKFMPAISAGFFGFVLAMVGFPFTTWQFWLLMILFAIHGALENIRGERGEGW